MGTFTDLSNFYMPVAHESNYETALNPNWESLDILLGSGAVNVRDPQFAGGAKGDGVTDDTAAIRAAIAATRFYAIGAGFGGATMPAALQGSAGGTIFFPPGVYCISDTIAPDQRGVTDAPGYSATKAISFIGAGYSSTRIKWIGASTTDPMLELGGDGAGNASNNSDQEGAVVRGIRFDGDGIAATGLHLIECGNTLIEHNAFGNLTEYGLLSDPDPVSGHDYGSIDLTVQYNYFGWRGAIGTATSGVAGVAARFVDSHALTVHMNEFQGGRHGNLRVEGGGGNQHRITNNSFEGMNGPQAQTDAGGPYHSVYLNTDQGTYLLGNAWEDGFSQALTPDCRALYFGGGGNYTVISNTFYDAADYVIEVASGLGSFEGLHLFGNSTHGTPVIKTVKIPADVGHVYGDLSAWGNMNFSFADPDGRMLIGPHSQHRGFTKMVVGAYDPATGHDVPIDGTTLEVRGDVWVDGFLEGPEITAPAAPAANRGRLFWRDNGSGKTQLCARYPTGAIQVLSTEP